MPFTAPAQVNLQARAQQPLANLLEFMNRTDGRTLFVAESTGRREAILDMLRDQKIRPQMFDNWQSFISSDNRTGITVAPLERGLSIVKPSINIISEPQIFGDRAQQRRRRRGRTRDAEAIIGNLTDLHIGAPVVHEDHGVGRYLGITETGCGGYRSGISRH